MGVPLACWLALKRDMGVLGLQIGVGVAISLQFFTYLTLLLRSDWQQIADEAQLRLEQESGKMSEKSPSVAQETNKTILESEESDEYCRAV